MHIEEGYHVISTVFEKVEAAYRKHARQKQKIYTNKNINELAVIPRVSWK